MRELGGMYELKPCFLVSPLPELNLLSIFPLYSGQTLNHDISRAIDARDRDLWYKICQIISRSLAIPHASNNKLQELVVSLTCNYADDTMIMVELSGLDIINLKSLLLCFKVMFGLKINFYKSEVAILGYSEDELQWIANNLNFRISSFPIAYLGIPLSNSRVHLRVSLTLMGQVVSRSEPWCCHFTSKGSKTILIDSFISSLLIYMMGLYIARRGS